MGKKKESVVRVELMVRLNVPPAFKKAIQRMAGEDQRSVPNLVRKILIDHLRNHRYLTDEEIKRDFLQT